MAYCHGDLSCKFVFQNLSLDLLASLAKEKAIFGRILTPQDDCQVFFSVRLGGLGYAIYKHNLQHIDRDFL